MQSRRDDGARRRSIHLVTAALGLLLVWLPLPFGSVTPWAHSVLRIVAFTLAGLCVVFPPRRKPSAALAIPILSLAAVAALGLLQSVSWPTSVASVVSAEHLDLSRRAVDLGSHVRSGVPLSLAPAVTRDSAFTWAAMAALLVTAVSIGICRLDRRVLFATITGSALFQVLMGAAVSGRTTRIWGLEVPGDASRVRGTFVNRDHLAVYLELALPVAFAATVWALRRARDVEAPERKIALVTVPVMIWLTLFVGLTFTGSRAGLIAALTGVVAQGLLLAAGTRRRLLSVTGLVAGLVGVGTAAVIGLQQALGRWLATSPYELEWNARLEVYRHTLDLWHRFPLAGSGLATYREAFPLGQPEKLGAWYWHAHNDYLELLATGGLIAAAVLLVGVAVVLLRLVRVLREAERTESRMAALAALGAIAAIAVHSFFDFGLSMPANAATLVVLCGLGMAPDLRHRAPSVEAAARLRQELSGNNDDT